MATHSIGKQRTMRSVGLRDELDRALTDYVASGSAPEKSVSALLKRLIYTEITTRGPAEIARSLTKAALLCWVAAASVVSVEVPRRPGYRAPTRLVRIVRKQEGAA